MAAYGVLWPGIGATLTRLGSNVGLTPGTDYNSLQPWGGMRRINLTDNGIITAIQNLAGTGCGYDDSQTGVAAKGQAMTMIPAFLIYVDTTGVIATSTVAAGGVSAGATVIPLNSTTNFGTTVVKISSADGTVFENLNTASVQAGTSITTSQQLLNSYAAGSTVTQYTTAWWVAPVGSTDQITRQDGGTHTFSPSDLHPAFLRNGVAKPYVFIGSYEGYYNSGTGKLESRAGASITNSYTFSAVRGYAQARNPAGTPTGANWVSGWSIIDWLTISAVQDLFMVETASTNSQGYLNGSTSASVLATGTTQSYGNTSYGGSSTVNMSYRGIEALYANYFAMIDGINFNNNVAWVADRGFSCDKFAAPYVNTGVTVAATVSPPIIATMNTTGPFNFGFLPMNNLGGTANSYGWCDALIGTNSLTPGNTVLARWGTLSNNSGTNGLFAMVTASASGTTSAGNNARLMFVPF